MDTSSQYETPRASPDTQGRVIISGTPVLESRLMCEDTIELGAITLPPAESNELAQRSTKTDIVDQ